MNDPSKRIDVNLSSLLSLKAELLRKKEEASKTNRKADTFVPKRYSSSEKKSHLDDANVNEKLTQNDNILSSENLLMLEKSKKILEAKSKFYNKMTTLGGTLNSDDNCLVMFNQKRQEDKSFMHKEAASSEEEDSDSEEDWVEFEDFLGRTRKCLRKDIEELKRKDNEIAKNMPERLDVSAPNWMIDTKGSHPPPEESVLGDVSMVSKHDEMRLNWEKKEEENVNKANIHYQDVFFDEARQHGVGYYAFSTDDDERAKQQKALEEMRKKTLAEQAEKDAQKIMREKIISERVRAAKNRQRARMGLPPLEDEIDLTNATQIETKEERKGRKKEDKRNRKKEAEEKKKEEERKNYVRPWDKHKDVLPNNSDLEDMEEKEWIFRPDRQPMSQEQWNERKRSERNEEFAPKPQKSNRTSFEQRYVVPPPDEYYCEPANFATYQSSKPQGFQRKNYVDKFAISDHPSRGACIPPPESIDSNPFKESLTNASLEQSIEAGLKFLRNNSDKGTLTTKSKWTSNADY